MGRHVLKVCFIALCTTGILVCRPGEISSQEKQVCVIQIKDYSINPITADYIIKAIDTAYQDGAACLIIELDTPGGLLTSTRAIVKKIMSARVPVVVFIYPSGSRAGSAGVFITYASHIAAMAPSTNIGAAHPVSLGGRDRSLWDAVRDLIDTLSRKAERTDKDRITESERTQREDVADDDVLVDKILNDSVAFLKAVAKERGRNINWAEQSIRESASITEEEALEAGVIELIARDVDELLDKLDGMRVKVDDQSVVLKTKDAAVQHREMDFRQRFLNVLANPNIAYILLLLGFYGLLFEVTHPGVGFPGVAGAICIILAFFSMQTLPTNYAGLALIVLAVILFIAEVRVPGFGLLTLGGVVCMILGSLILFESPDDIMRVSLALVLAFSLTTAGITIFLVGAVIRAHRKKVMSGKEGLAGEIGRAQTSIESSKEGKVFVHGEIWNAVAQVPIKKGEKIRVVKVDGMNLIVERTT